MFFAVICVDNVDAASAGLAIWLSAGEAAGVACGSSGQVPLAAGWMVTGPVNYAPRC